MNHSIRLMLAAGLFAAAPSNAQQTGLRTGVATPGPRATDSTGIILLGTHGTYGMPPGGSGTGTAITVGERLFVFDAGEGVLHQIAEAGLRSNRIEAIFITTLRDDHVLGLPALLVTPRASGRTSPVAVFGPAGTRETATRMWAAFESARKEKVVAAPVAMRQSMATVIDTGAYATDIRPGIVYDSAGVRVTAFLIDHGASTNSYGYRIDTPGRSVAISGDTRPSENLAKAAVGVDVLIHNVYALAKVNDTAFFASSLASAEEAGAMAARIRPRLLILTHILPNGRATDAELIAGVRKGGFTGAVVVGRDLEHY
jgi:ribonuclease Z